MEEDWMLHKRSGKPIIASLVLVGYKKNHNNINSWDLGKQKIPSIISVMVKDWEYNSVSELLMSAQSFEYVGDFLLSWTRPLFEIETRFVERHRSDYYL